MKHYNSDDVECTFKLLSDNSLFELNGAIKKPDAYLRVIIMAAAPINKMTSYSGSGLPYPCRQIAFQNTPNYYEVNLNDGKIKTVFAYPNSYYDLLATPDSKIPPSVEILFFIAGAEEPYILRIPLHDPLPLKTLTFRPGRDPVFYVRQELMDITGQEEYLRTIGNAKVQLHTA